MFWPRAPPDRKDADAKCSQPRRELAADGAEADEQRRAADERRPERRPELPHVQRPLHLVRRPARRGPPGLGDRAPGVGKGLRRQREV